MIGIIKGIVDQIIVRIFLGADKKRDKEGDETSNWVEVAHPLPEDMVAIVCDLSVGPEGVHEEPEDSEWAPELDAESPPDLEGRFPPHDFILSNFLAKFRHRTRQFPNAGHANRLEPCFRTQARLAL